MASQQLHNEQLIEDKRNDEISGSENASTQADPSGKDGSSDSSKDKILRSERDLNVLVKLKYLMEIDERTNSCIGKTLTNVHCESVNHEAASRRSRDLALEGESAAYNKDWSNLGLLTTALMGFVNGELQERDTERNPKRNGDRIHFAKPEVEKKWRMIVSEERQKKRKISHTNGESVNSWASAKINTSKLHPTLGTSISNRIGEASAENGSVISPSEETGETMLESNTASMDSAFGPIPAVGSKLFEGMSFVLEYVSLGSISLQQLEAMKSSSEAEYLDEWTRRPFVRERLISQIVMGGGKLYKRSQLVPVDKYAETKLIMNIPTVNEESLFCLSVGIQSYSHQWIIRCCIENKIVNPAEERFPIGWSLTAQSYVETYQRRRQNPFRSDSPFIVVIPMHHPHSKFALFWERIIRNSGGVAHLVEKRDDDFSHGTVVLAYSGTPAWAVKRAQSYGIPIVTSQWAVECLIVGEIFDYDAHPSFEYS